MPTTGMDRGNFLRTLLGGIAAAPMAATAIAADRDLSGKLIERNDVSVKRWEHGGIKFAEWTFPATVPPFFEAADADKMIHNTPTSVVLHGKDAAEGMEHERRFIAPRRVLVPVFNRKTVRSTMEELVARVLDSYQNTEMVIRYGKKPEGFDPSRGRPKHFIIVKVHGKPDLMGLAALPDENVPVRDFYRGV